MTSLSEQLKRLATPQTDLYSHHKRHASILFAASEIDNYSKETIYQIGISGFKELLEINDQFIEFRESIYGIKSKEFQRAVESVEVNKELDKTIEKFLLLLSPYLQKQASLKALEWLVNRFLINEMNVDSVMMCIFPYYETILFVRILQILKIENSKSPWKWLLNSQSKGRPISKFTVFQHWASDQWFRNFLSNYFLKMMKIHKKTKNLQMATSLFMSTTIGGLNAADKITTDHISSVCRTIGKCLSSNDNDVMAGSFIIICQLCISVQLSADLLKAIVHKLVKIEEPQVIEQNALCLLALFYHQENMKDSLPALIYLDKNEPLKAEISKLSLKKPVSHLFSPFVKVFLKDIFADENLEDYEKRDKILKLIEFINSMPLNPQESSIVIRSLLEGFSSLEKEIGAMEGSIDFTKLMKQLETNHSEGFDDACAKIMEDFIPDSVTFEQNIIKKFRKTWVIGMKSSKLQKRERREKEKKKMEENNDAEVQWLECLKGGKLTKSSLKFLEKTCLVIHLPEDKMNLRFWQIDGEDNFAMSLRLLIKLIKVIVIHQIQNKDLETCEELLKTIFKEKLGKIDYQLYFLSMIWGWNLDLEDVGIDRSLKLWALNFTSALLSSSKSKQKSLSWVLDSDQPLIPSLITPICEGQFLCAAAFKVLNGMQTIVGGRLRSNNLSDLVEALVGKKEEISADVSWLPSTISAEVSEKKGMGPKIVESLLACVLNDVVSLHIKSSILYALSDVGGVEILSQLIPFGNSLLDKVDALSGKEMDVGSSTCLYYILLRVSAKDAVFLKVKGGWEFFLRSLEKSEPILKVSGKLLSPQEVVVNYKLLQELTNSNKEVNVLEILIDRIVKSKNSRKASKLSKELKKLNLSASKIISMWKKLDLIPNFKSVQEARAKKLKLQKSEGKEDKMESWRKLELIIELIGVMEDLEDPWMLVAPLCDHMNELLKMESGFVDTLQQQMLSVCHHLMVLSKDRLTKEEFSKKCKLNVALIVKCIRTSMNPDTHRRALLILSLASSYFPDQVLHNIMAIFTFMGTSLLRRDDAYSFHVIHLTISSIVPTLIQAESSDPKLLLKKLSQVTQVFVDALPDLAEHRRLPLFTQLASTLGVSSYLWLVMVQIADAYVSRTATAEDTTLQDDDPRRLPRNIQFALVLYSQFSILDQLKASREVIEFVTDLPENKESIKNMENVKDKRKSTIVINIQTKTSRQLRQLKYTCLGLLVQLLASERFVSQVYEFTNESSEKKVEKLKHLYKDLLERSFSYLRVVSQQEQYHKGQATGRFWSAMQRKLMDLIDSVNSLLPPPLLIEVISDLLLSKSELIRCRAMEILASKLHPEANFFDNKEAKNLVGFIDPLQNIATNSEESENNKQTALFSLQLMVRRLWSLVDPEVLTPILGMAAQIIRDADSPSKVTTQAALVVAESVHALKLHSLVHLNKLMPALIKILQKALQEDNQNVDNLVIAAATAIHRIAETVPKLLPQKELKSMITVSCLLISNQEEEGFKESKLSTRLSSSLEQLVQSIELRIFIPTLKETFDELAHDNIPALPTLISVSESLIGFVKASDLVMYKEFFISLFKQCLDLKSKKVDEDDETIERVETCVISALIRFLLKLNEDDNVTIVTLLLNWAWERRAKYPTRLTTFFRFTSQLSSRLKVLFIKAKLSNIIFNHAAETLDMNNNFVHSDTIFGTGPEAENKASVLVRHVLETLSNIFIYDSVQFTTDEKFNIIVEPLTNQIENTIGTDEDYRSRISGEVKSCIIHFTKAVGDDTLWKELNRQILFKVRTENDSKVILGGLEVFEGLVEALGEDYLQPLLADTIPCIIEVLESLDPDVERKTKEVFNRMESILGDSLRAYLDG